jgi:hypothetical protein
MILVDVTHRAWEIQNATAYSPDPQSDSLPKGTGTGALDIEKATVYCPNPQSDSLPKGNGTFKTEFRGLDRSGKPCRKWRKGKFKLKSITGVVWEIPGWQSLPRLS